MNFDVHKCFSQKRRCPPRTFQIRFERLSVPSLILTCYGNCCASRSGNEEGHNKWNRQIQQSCIGFLYWTLSWGMQRWIQLVYKIGKSTSLFLRRCWILVFGCKRHGRYRLFKNDVEYRLPLSWGWCEDETVLCWSDNDFWLWNILWNSHFCTRFETQNLIYLRSIFGKYGTWLVGAFAVWGHFFVAKDFRCGKFGGTRDKRNKLPKIDKRWN